MSSTHSYYVGTCDLYSLLSEETVHSTLVFEAHAFPEWPAQDSGPYFDTAASSNVTGLVGKTIQLVCKVKNLGNRTVSIFYYPVPLFSKREILSFVQFHIFYRRTECMNMV